MTRTALLRNTFCVTLLTLALASPAHAVPRTFISGKGDDGNTGASPPCQPTTPCRTFAQAFTVTDAGGEIVAMDAGGYGSVTITKALTITGVDGATTGVPSGGIGLTINPGAGNLVVIRNLQINGIHLGSNTGIQLNSGGLALENVGFTALTTGLSASARSHLYNTSFIGNATAILTNGAGVPWQSGANIYNTQACQTAGACPALIRIAGGNFVSNATVFTENNPTSPGGQPSATIWTSQNQPPNMTGYGTLLTTTGTGAGGSLTAPQTYFTGQFN
jgi:hypothetical protein